MTTSTDGSLPHTATEAHLELTEAYAAHNYHPLRVVLESGEGAWVTDVEGRRYLDIGDAAYAKLDAACTAYLRAISSTRKLTGIANVDVDEWPTPEGSYPIYCDSDRRPDQKSLITQGSVYDRDG